MIPIISDDIWATGQLFHHVDFFSVHGSTLLGLADEFFDSVIFFTLHIFYKNNIAVATLGDLFDLSEFTTWDAVGFGLSEEI